MSNTHYYGAAYGPQSSHVNCWISKETGEIVTNYNLADHTGDHPFTRASRKQYPFLIEMETKAIEEAVHKMLYGQARRRDTAIEKFQYAFLVTWGRGGSSVHIDEEPGCSCTQNGYGFSAEDLEEIDRLQIPFVDTRTVPDKIAAAMIGFPMWPSKPDRADNAPWGPISYAPIPVLAALYARIGATVKHIELAEINAEQFRSYSTRERLAVEGFQHNDPVKLGTAMMMAREEN